MQEEVIKLFPKTVIITSEFDCYRHDSSQMASRLFRYGKLAEFVVLPGLNHGSPLLVSSESEFQTNFWNVLADTIKWWPADFSSDFKSKFIYELKGEWDPTCLESEKFVAKLPRINYWIILLKRWLTPLHYWDDYWTPFFDQNEITDLKLGGPKYHPLAET